jgi:GT2 family glycosyltransferase
MSQFMPKLSIVILSYNTKDLLINCLVSLQKVKKEVSFEVVVVDNSSTDGTVEEVKKLKIKNLKLIENSENLGFARGNNSARKHVSGGYVLFLNSDTEVYRNTLKETVKYMDNNSGIGALTCKTVLLSGKLDLDARRSFPTPWTALTHFSYLDRIFNKSKLIARYWYTYRSANEIQDIDVLQGAFCLVRKKILDDIDWFNEKYFLDGEDIDLCWKIKNLGYRIVYYPKVEILHIKKASKRRRKRTWKLVLAGVNAMEIFYKDRMWERYPLVINTLVLLAIYFMKVVRVVRSFV